MIRQDRSALLCLVGALCFAHFVASVWSLLMQHNFGFVHADDRTGFIWTLSLATMRVTTWPILAPAGFGSWLHRLAPLSGLTVIALNSILAVALFAGVGACSSAPFDAGSR